MQELEARFGKPHPELEGFKAPSRTFSWLVDAFFRLHKRRQLGESGIQPLSFTEIATYGEKVIRVSPDLVSLYVQTMEETDNAVLFDSYDRTSKKIEELKNAPKGRKGRK